MKPSAIARPAYFDARKLPKPPSRYVCWLDLVGAANAMRLSLPRAANFIAKIHVAGQRARVGCGISVYPAIDGLYAVAARRPEMEAFLRAAHDVLIRTFLSETDQRLRFLVRCGVAYGQIIEGKDFVKGAPDLAKAAEYANAVAVGIAISQAYEAEKAAPFFGVAIDDSARSKVAGGDKPFADRTWHWLDSAVPMDRDLSAQIGAELSAYFDWAGTNAEAILFPADKLPKYRKLARDYFG